MKKLWIEPWGENALRVRSTKMPQMPPENWALEAPHSASAEIVVGEKEAAVTNGKITAKVTKAGKLTFYNQNGKLLLEEFVRNRRDVTSRSAARSTWTPASTGRFSAAISRRPCGLNPIRRKCCSAWASTSSRL